MNNFTKGVKNSITV